MRTGRTNHTDPQRLNVVRSLEDFEVHETQSFAFLHPGPFFESEGLALVAFKTQYPYADQMSFVSSDI